MKTTQPTPLEKLIAEKKEIRFRLREQEEKLSADFSYVQEHAGSLLLSGITSLFFPSSGKAKTSETEENGSPFGHYWAIAMGIVPLVWEAVLPIMVRWLVKKVGSLFRRKPVST